jgi:hypothetical protein
MSGLSDYSARNVMNYLTGQVAMPPLPAIYLALFTAAPASDAGPKALRSLIASVQTSLVNQGDRTVTRIGEGIPMCWRAV